MARGRRWVTMDVAVTFDFGGWVPLVWEGAAPSAFRAYLSWTFVSFLCWWFLGGGMLDLINFSSLLFLKRPVSGIMALIIPFPRHFRHGKMHVAFTSHGRASMEQIQVPCLKKR